MSNLLPHEGVRNVRREYTLRVLSVWALLLGCACVSTIIFLFPTYLLLSTRSSVLADTHPAESEVTESQAVTDARTTLKRAMDTVSVLQGSVSSFGTHYILSELKKEVRDDIHIEGIVLTPNEVTKEVTAQVRGRADTREALASFVDTLKQNPHFSSASVPVSDLASAINASFLVTVVVAPKP